MNKTKIIRITKIKEDPRESPSSEYQTDLHSPSFSKQKFISPQQQKSQLSSNIQQTPKKPNYHQRNFLSSSQTQRTPSIHDFSKSNIRQISTSQGKKNYDLQLQKQQVSFPEQQLQQEIYDYSYLKAYQPISRQTCSSQGRYHTPQSSRISEGSSKQNAETTLDQALKFRRTLTQIQQIDAQPFTNKTIQEKINEIKSGNNQFFKEIIEKFEKQKKKVSKAENIFNNAYIPKSNQASSICIKHYELKQNTYNKLLLNNWEFIYFTMPVLHRQSPLTIKFIKENKIAEIRGFISKTSIFPSQFNCEKQIECNSFQLKADSSTIFNFSQYYFSIMSNQNTRILIHYTFGNSHLQSNYIKPLIGIERKISNQEGNVFMMTNGTLHKELKIIKKKLRNKKSALISNNIQSCDTTKKQQSKFFDEDK